MLENKELRKISVAEREEITGEWRKCHNAALHALYSSPNIIKNLNSKRLRWAGHVDICKNSEIHRVLIGKPEGEREADGRIILK